MTMLGPFSIDFITTSDILTHSPPFPSLSKDLGHTSQDHKLLSMNKMVLIELTNNPQESSHNQIGCSAHDQLARWTPFNLDPLSCSGKRLESPGRIWLKKHSAQN